MSTPPLDDDLAREVVDTLRRCGDNQSEAARAMGLSRQTFRSRLEVAARRGLLGFSPVLPGFNVSKTTEVLDANGVIARQFIQQKPSPGDKFEVPEGHVVKGISSLVDADGNVVNQWIKTREGDHSLRMEDAIKAAAEAYTGHTALPEPSIHTDDDLLTIYPIVDLHLGLYAWGKETGADYDLDIASDLLKNAVKQLVARSANATQAIILDMGDYFHTDDSRNQTKRSHNPLDVDTRYAKVLQTGVELARECIELALQKHRQVVYRKLPGNHDDESSLMLAINMASWFRNDPRVRVDTDPSRFFKHVHGRVMIAATHGDMLKMNDMASFMASNWPKEWGDTEFRYAYTGHVHHDRVKSGGGVRAESFNTLAAKDAWHAASGYVSSRSAVSITMHKEKGEVDRFTINLPR